jgi:hypothetical protein
MQPHPAAEANRSGGEPAAVPRSRASRALGILWPAFVMAGVLEMLVFAVVDPAVLQDVPALGLSRNAVYSMSFFVFWAAISLSAAVTQWLEQAGSP